MQHCIVDSTIRVAVRISYTYAQCAGHISGLRFSQSGDQVAQSLFPISFPLSSYVPISACISTRLNCREAPLYSLIRTGNHDRDQPLHLHDKNVIRAKDVKHVWLLFIFPWLVSFKYLSYVRDWYLYLNDPSSVSLSAPWWGSFTEQLMKRRPKRPTRFQISAWLLRWNMQTFDWYSAIHPNEIS